MNVVITASQKMGDENPIIYEMQKKRTNATNFGFVEIFLFKTRTKPSPLPFIIEFRISEKKSKLKG